MKAIVRNSFSNSSLLLRRRESGFTLIEIVIVIAIAALILAAILVFVPQAQKSQRDSDRKNAAAKVLSKLVECAGNNAGAACTTAQMASYNTGINPPGSSTPYTITVSAATPTAAQSPPSACTVSNTAFVFQSPLNSAASAQIVEMCLEGPGQWYQAGK